MTRKIFLLTASMYLRFQESLEDNNIDENPSPCDSSHSHQRTIQKITLHTFDNNVLEKVDSNTALVEVAFEAVDRKSWSHAHHFTKKFIFRATFERPPQLYT